MAAAEFHSRAIRDVDVVAPIVLDLIAPHLRITPLSASQLTSCVEKW
jgi:hypothetical protein